MEPISAIVLSLSLGAGAVVGKEVVSLAVKDAYAGLKSLIRSRYPEVEVTPIEQAPASETRRAVVQEDLVAAGAGQDVELMAAARVLIDLVQKQEPFAAQAVGVDLKEVTAANLRLTAIVTTGDSVRVQSSTFSGDIEIHGVRAGLPPLNRKDV